MTRKRDYALDDDGVTSHAGLSGLGADDHQQYLHNEISRTILAQHTFNPLKVSPFLIGLDAYNILVKGLNADQLDGNEATAFAAAVHAHIKANITDLESISATPAATTIPLADVAGKIALGWLLTGPGNGLDADTVDGQHAADIAGISFSEALTWGTL